MKFCQRLRQQKAEIFDEGSDACNRTLDYKRLKKAISALKTRIEEEQLDEQAVAKEVQLWLADFEEEVEKFDAHFIEDIVTCEEEIAEFEQAMVTKQKACKNAMKESYLHMQELKFFVELNKEATRKILKKFDKNVPGHNTGKWREEQGTRLPSFCDDRLQGVIMRLVSVYAALFHNNRAKLAEMELDYHVSCVSDLFSYMIENDPATAGKKDAGEQTGEDAQRNSSDDVQRDSA